MVKSKKSTKSLHPIVQPGDCVVSGLLYSQVIVLWVVSCTDWWLCCEWSLVQCTAWWLCCVWSLVQPSDCVVSGHVYSLVIVCCIWSLVQPGDSMYCMWSPVQPCDCVLCAVSLIHSATGQKSISPQKTHKGYKAAKVEKKKQCCSVLSWANMLEQEKSQMFAYWIFITGLSKDTVSWDFYHLAFLFAKNFANFGQFYYQKLYNQTCFWRIMWIINFFIQYFVESRLVIIFMLWTSKKKEIRDVMALKRSF